MSEMKVIERPAQEVKTRLLILGFDCAPAAISEVLGVAPTRTWSTGDRVIPQATKLHSENGWVLRSPSDPEHTTPEESIRALLASLPNHSAIEQIRSRGDVQVTCTIYTYKHRPSLFLPPDLMAQLAALGASLDVDIYDLSESASEEDQ